MIDVDGYRPNVGIVLLNADGRLFWARRVNRDGWQFPQGGMRSDETPLEAMYRELEEETGLAPQHVEVLGATRGWLRYRLPSRYVRHHQRPTCIGQKQVWFLLRLVGGEDALKLDACDKPEFDIWRWVDFWYPASHVVNFKRQVYERAFSWANYPSATGRTPVIAPARAGLPPERTIKGCTRFRGVR
jgi:putative (di)nucleoside polyphosphate hydrolase